MTDDKSLLQRQIEYYRARAAEYDDWHQRRGRYDRGEEHWAGWLGELDVVRDALVSAKPRGNVLELACGTGLWTPYLVLSAECLVAVDVSSEAIEINRGRMADGRVSYITTDLFSWQPSERFDFVFFGFWLSHVPALRFDAFWRTVADALNPGGRVFFVDSLFTQESTAIDHTPIDHSGRAQRKLDDGREYEIVKEFYEPNELMRRLGDLGWSGYVHATETFFLYSLLERAE